MSFTLEVSVTEKCNLGCPYCYVANKPTFMTPATFDNAIPELYDLMKKSGDTEYQVSLVVSKSTQHYILVLGYNLDTY